MHFPYHRNLWGYMDYMTYRVINSDENGRPDLETLDALEGCTFVRTDQNGWIEIKTDGQQVWVDVEK